MELITTSRDFDTAIDRTMLEIIRVSKTAAAATPRFDAIIKDLGNTLGELYVEREGLKTRRAAVNGYSYRVVVEQLKKGEWLATCYNINNPEPRFGVRAKTHARAVFKMYHALADEFDNFEMTVYFKGEKAQHMVYTNMEG